MFDGSLNLRVGPVSSSFCYVYANLFEKVPLADIELEIFRQKMLQKAAVVQAALARMPRNQQLLDRKQERT
jgi:hypothetical protein